MGPIQINDGVRSKSDCVEHDKFGVCTGRKTIINEKGKKELLFYILWENYLLPLPHRRKSLARDHTLRNIAKAEIYKKVEAKNKAKKDLPPDADYSSDIDLSCRDYKPTTRDYYHEKKEKKRLDDIAAAEKAAAEEVDLEKRLEANISVDKTMYKTPDLTNVVFASYPQQKYKLASDYSSGPCFVFLPYKIVI
jgi:hypothetical protein